MAVTNPLLTASDEAVHRMTLETTKAQGLANEAFTSTEFLSLELEYLFSRTWVFAGVLSDVPNQGDIKPITVAGRELFMVTNYEGITKVFFNVCPHRGARLVVDDKNNSKVLTCPYHAWSFTLDGKLRGRPHFHGPNNHDKSSTNDIYLFEVRSATWNDWVFVNLDGQAPEFDSYMESLMRRNVDWKLDSFHLGHYQSYEFHCNWKLAVENYFDNYHVFKIHPQLIEMQNMSDNTGMTIDGYHMFNYPTIAGEGRGLTVDPDGPTLPDVAGISSKIAKQMRYCTLFPNSAINMFTSNVEFLMFEPVSVNETIMHMWFYFSEEAATSDFYSRGREAVVADWTALNAEDSDICERLQFGRSCDAYDGGRFSTYWDTGTLHFHRQIAEAIRGLGKFSR